MLLTFSATAYGTVVRGVQQVGAVTVGLFGAGGLILLLGINGITLAILVAGGLVVTRLLNLPKQNVQIPITALLVFALGATYSLERLVDLLLGAVIGILANLVVLPPRYVEEARREMAELAGDLSSLSAAMGKGVRGAWGEDEARSWLERSREVDARLRESQEVAEQAAESVRLVPLRRRRQDEQLDQVAEAMTCLDHAGLQLRGIARSLTDLAAGVRGLPAEDVHRVPAALGDELLAISKAFAAFGLAPARPGQRARPRPAADRAARERRAPGAGRRARPRHRERPAVVVARGDAGPVRDHQARARPGERAAPGGVPRLAHPRLTVPVRS
ncbi:hypothetical protein ACFSTC_52730 [Nonomuraea ferruginea]